MTLRRNGIINKINLVHKLKDTYHHSYKHQEQSSPVRKQSQQTMIDSVLTSLLIIHDSCSIYIVQYKQILAAHHKDNFPFSSYNLDYCFNLEMFLL